MPTVVIRKIFGTGQVTLPKSWRDRVGADAVAVRERNGELRISPIKLKPNVSDAIFDSAKCGYPKGVEIKKFLKALKKANG